MKTSKEEEVERVLETTQLGVGTRVVELSGVNMKYSGVLMEILKYMQRFKEAVSKYCR